MAFDFHPILEAGDTLRPNQWYVVSPEGSDSSSAPCQRVGACANFVAGVNGEGCGKVLLSAGAAPEGLCSDLHELIITKDSLRWRKLHDGDVPARYEHATFTLGSDLFIFAGAQTTGPLNDIWKYQYSSSHWTVMKGKGSIPPPRTYHSNTSYWYREKEGGQFLVFSGGAVGTTPVRDRKVYKFDPATGEWTTPSTSGTPPTPRQGHIVAVVGNKMFVHGGMSGQQIFNDLCALNLDKWVWSRLKVKGVPSPSLAAHSCAVLDSRLYLFGGLTPEGSASHQLYCLHTDSLTLGQVDIIGPPPPARLDHAMCTVHLPTIPPTTTRDCELKESKLPTPPATAKATGIPSSSRSTSAPPPHTVTVIRPEGGGGNFSIVSDPDSTTQATLNPGYSCGNDPSEPGSGETVATSDDQEALEGNCTHRLEALSLSGKDIVSEGSTALNRTSTSVDDDGLWTTIPALFVFGGMDTQETVHGDAFIFVP